MNMLKKKRLAARTLNVGIDRIRFNEERIEEIKEAITKQDIRDLFASKAIIIKPARGKKKAVNQRRKRGEGKIRRKVRGKEYVILTRKLRGYISQLRKQGKIDKLKYDELRKRIRERMFRSKSHLRSLISQNP